MMALLVQVIAVAGWPGPRRAAAILTWKTWLVLCAAGIAMGLASIYHPWVLPTWQAAGLVVAFLAAVVAGLVLSLPKPARAPFPQLVILLVLLLACVSAVAAWQARHGRGTA